MRDPAKSDLTTDENAVMAYLWAHCRGLAAARTYAVIRADLQV